MIEVVKNGKEKTFYARCFKCASEMRYKAEDVKHEKGIAQYGESQFIVCPVCGEIISVNLLSEEEVKNNIANRPNANMSFCYCA